MSAGIYNIPADIPFSDVLARVLLDRYRHQPLQLSEVQIFLPTRRAVRNLSDSFLRESQGKALLLPRFHTLGDLDDEELSTLDTSQLGFEASPALEELEEDRTPWNDAHRLLVAMYMLHSAKLGGREGEPLGHEQQLAMANSLLRLLDQTETESLDIADIKTLVDGDDLAEHWQKSLDFLALLSDVWPTLEARFGKTGAARLRRLRAEAQIELWRLNPPKGPLIAAGTTASIPATRKLLLALSKFDNAEILLPGLDHQVAQSPNTWALVGKDPTHPQYGLHQLTKALDIDAHLVRDWPAASAEIRDTATQARLALAQWAALPPEATQPDPDHPLGHDGWRNLPYLPLSAPKARDIERFQRGLQGIELVKASDQNHEAKIIALILRHVLEQPGQRAALVTPNRDLARMVAAQMQRWGQTVDDSAGTPLDKAPAARLVRSVLDLVCDGAPPSSLLDLLKNPLITPQAWAQAEPVTALERLALRGPRPGRDLGTLVGVLERQHAKAASKSPPDDKAKTQAIAALDLVEAVRQRLEPLDACQGEQSLLTLTKALVQTLENFVPASELYCDDSGYALSTLLAGLVEDEGTAGALKLPNLGLFRNYLCGLLNRATVRLPYQAHPRISVLGTLEARLLNVDHVVLGGLNEDSFPMNSEPGPWLSRQMRARFGLPPLERKVGLTAHDFIQALGNRKITLTRAVKEAGAQTTPSRFLRRLESYLRQLELSQGLDLLDQFNAPIDPALCWSKWADELDRPTGITADGLTLDFQPAVPATRPTPNPPLSARPSVLYATDIEQWRANPYALYAKRILRLKPWDPLEIEADARARGTLIHAAAEAFVEAKQALARGAFDTRLESLGSPQTDLAYYMARIEEQMALINLDPHQRVLWRSRIENAGRWFVEAHNLRMLSGLDQTLVEALGSWTMPLGSKGNSVNLAARADRIERYQSGEIRLVDYKTGTPPSPTDVFSGQKPQLAIEALIALNGRVDGLPKPSSTAAQQLVLEYWAMGGGKVPGRIKSVEPPKAMEQTLPEALLDIQEALEDMLSKGLTQRTAFVATAAGWGDYHHLSRLQEWSGLETSIQDLLTRGTA